MPNPFDNKSQSTSRFTRRNAEKRRFDAASVARYSIFATLLAVGTLPVSFFFATNFSPFIVYALFYGVLGLVAFALRTPSRGGVREDASERTDARANESAD